MKKLLSKNFYFIIFFLIATFPKINVINVPGTYVGIRISDLFIMFYVLFILYRLYKNKWKFSIDKNIQRIAIAMGIYSVCCLISTFYGYFKGYISLLMGILYLLRKIEYFLYIFVGYDLLRFSANKEYSKRKFFVMFDYIILFHFVVGLLQLFGIVGAFNRSEYGSSLIQNRVSSTFNGAYELSAFLLLLLPFYCYKVFLEKKISLKNIFILIMIGILIFISQSRISLIIFFIIIFIYIGYYIYLNKIKINFKYLVYFGLMLCLIIPIMLNFKILGFERFSQVNVSQFLEATEYAWENRDFDRYIQTGDWYNPEDFYINSEGKLNIAVDVDPSFFVRVSHWSQLLDGFTKSPAIGTGLSISKTAADGNYVRIIAESGLLGFAFWIILQFYIVKVIKGKNYYNFSLKCSLLTLFIGAIFIDVFEASKIMTSFYFLLGLIAFINCNNEKKEKKLKNLVIINDFNYIEGGASKVAIETAKVMKERIDNVYFFCADYKKNNIINGVNYISTHQVASLNSKNVFIGAINGIYNLKASYMLSRLLSNLDSDETIVHVHGWTKALSSSVFNILFRYNYKVVLTAHDYFSACPNGGYFNYVENKICNYVPLSKQCITCNCDSRNYGFKLYRLIRQFVQNNIVKLNKRLKYVIGISDLNIKVLKKTLGVDTKITKITNPIDIKRSEAKNHIKNNDIYLYLGRVTKEKGIDIFCEMITALNLKGVVIGDGTELKRLKRVYKNILFTGWLEKKDIDKYLTKTRILVFPSLWYEGAPLTPLEAMSYGIPCLISNCSSAVEYIILKNGEVFDPYDKSDFEKKLKKIENDIEEYSDNAYKTISKLCSIDYGNNLINYYRSIL